MPRSGGFARRSTSLACRRSSWPRSTGRREAWQTLHNAWTGACAQPSSPPSPRGSAGMVRARPLSGTRPQRLSSAVHRHGDEHEAGARADARDLTPDPIEIVEAAHCRSSRSLSAATAGFATAFLRPYGEIRPTLQEALIAFRRTRRRDCRRREGAPVSNDLDSFVCLTHILSLECKYPFRGKMSCVRLLPYLIPSCPRST
jgi:hypothetical protein